MIPRGGTGNWPTSWLALTVQKPAHWTLYLGYTLWIIYLAACLAGGPWLLWRTGNWRGRRLGRQGRTSAWALPISLLAGALWAAALISVAFLWAFAACEWSVPEHQLSTNHRNDYSIALTMFLASAASIVVAGPLGIVFTQLTAYFACRKFFHSGHKLGVDPAAPFAVETNGPPTGEMKRAVDPEAA